MLINQFFLCVMKSIINCNIAILKKFVTKIYSNHLTIIQKCFVLLKTKNQSNNIMTMSNALIKLTK